MPQRDETNIVSLASELSQRIADLKFETVDRATLLEFAKRFKILRQEAERLTTPVSEFRTARPVELDAGVQSKQFMAEILPILQKYFNKLGQENQRLDVLDVGPGNCHGTNFLASLYQSSRLGLRARVTALDIIDKYIPYSIIATPFVKLICEDIYSHTNIYDFVLASHVIEHVSDPLKFVRRMQELSCGYVMVVAPFAERGEILTSGHINIFHTDFLSELGAFEIQLLDSEAWGKSLKPRYKMFVAVLSGKARATEKRPISKYGVKRADFSKE